MRGAFLRHVAKTSTFNQVVEFLSKVSGVIPRSFQGLRHQQNFEAGSVSLRCVFGKVLLEHGMANTVDIFIHLQDLAGGFQIEGDESFVNEIEHLAQGLRHGHELAHVGHRHLAAAGLHAQSDAHYQVADAFEIRRALQAGQQLARSDFVDARNGCWQLIVNLALKQVEFFFAVFDGEKSHAGVAGEQVADVESGVAGDQAGSQGQAREIFVSTRALPAASWPCRSLPAVSRCGDGIEFFLFGLDKRPG